MVVVEMIAQTTGVSDATEQERLKLTAGDVVLRRVMTGHVGHRRSVPNSEEVAAVIPKRTTCVHVLLRQSLRRCSARNAKWLD